MKALFSTSSGEAERREAGDGRRAAGRGDRGSKGS
jgi:hypothetical protein